MKIIRPTNILDSGGGFSRSSIGSYFDSTGTLQIAAPHEPRITYNPVDLTHIGLLIESAATNILLNSDVVVTQDITVSAVPYTLSYYGSGGIILTGAYVTGYTLPGGAPGERMDFEFTPTAGTLTVTVVGTVIYGQLETGSRDTSYIPTTSVPVTRAADVVTGTGLIYSSLPEAAGTLLTKPETLANQSLAVTAQPYTLSFTGLGSVALSGAAGGTLSGTGISNRVSYTFTPSAGTLTLSVTGECLSAQLEVGSAMGPYVNETEWNPATNYTLGQRVCRTTQYTHTIYENLIAGTNATLPEAIPTRWIEVSPTNRWSLFDEQVGTSSQALTSMTYLVKPGRINSLALLEVSADSVEVSLVLDTGEIVYSSYADLNSGTTVGDWYQYFYDPIYEQDAIVITNLLDTALLNIPAYGSATLAIRFNKSSGIINCGVAIAGLSVSLGITQTAPTISIIDYSRKEADAYGDLVIVKRKYSKRVGAVVQFPSPTTDNIARLLAQYRSTPLVWVGAENLYTSLIVYGFYRDFEITIDNILMSSCNLQIEGLT